MSTVRKRFTFTANEVKPNLLTGLTEEFLARPSAVKIFASQVAATEIKLDVQIGNTSIAKDLEPSVQADGVIKRAEDLLVSTVGAPGDRIQLRAVEYAGDALSVLSVQVEISELA